MMEAVRTSETSVDNHFTRQYIPEDNSEHFHIVKLNIHDCNMSAKLSKGNDGVMSNFSETV
jgi:hypothetical protein